jgi:hypothetical protein
MNSKSYFYFGFFVVVGNKIVTDARKISIPTDNLETGQHFNHDIQRRLSYKSFVERKWWSISGSKNFLFLYNILIFSAANLC